jgi:acetyltransferase
MEAKSILKAEGIPIAATVVASDPEEVRSLAKLLLSETDAVVVKILSHDISHKSDVGGVRLGLETPEAAELAASEMIARARKLRPGAHIEGFMVEPMIKRPNAHELIIGMSEDPAFGPMLLFGAGGVAVEVIADTALSLLPLDAVLAHQLIEQTRVARLLKGYRDRPPVNMDALIETLLRVSQLIVRHPEIRELDINPLLVDDKGVIALDARLRIADPRKSPRMSLAIKPYPSEWERVFELPGVESISVRPVKPEDERLYQAFFQKLSTSDIRMRFFTPKASRLCARNGVCRALTKNGRLTWRGASYLGTGSRSWRVCRSRPL